MFRNYLKAALRGLKRQKTFAAINILGLAVGLAGCLLIFLYVADELVLRPFPRAGGVHSAGPGRLHKEDGSVESRTSSMPAAAAPLFATSSPRSNMSSVSAPRGARSGPGRPFRNEVTFTDPGVFALFSFPLIAGDPASVLADENSLVLTRSDGRQIFGRAIPSAGPRR